MLGLALMEDRIDCTDDQRPEDQREAHQCDCGRRPDQQEAFVVDAEDRTEQETLQRHRRAGGGQDEDAEGEGGQVERRQTRILADDCHTGEQAGQRGDGDTGGQPANDHGAHRQTGNHESDDDSRHNSVSHRLAGERQAPEHQECSDRGDGETQHRRRGQSSDHERVVEPLKHRLLSIASTCLRSRRPDFATGTGERPDCRA